MGATETAITPNVGAIVGWREARPMQGACCLSDKAASAAGS